MNVHLSNPQQPNATQAEQPLDEAQRRAAEIAAAVDDIYDGPTYYKDPTTPPAIGPTPPVPQPGRPAMSSKATDDSVRMISAGFLTLCAGGATAAVLHFSGEADPTVIGLMAAVPAGLAIPIVALSRLVKRTKEAAEAAPPVHHHHYNGTVNQDQRSINSKTSGFVANTRNQLPR
ncbi:hypothetical protein [Streptomyces sp. NPDC093589]|uniref:hypothetical protein n=1 Tax=Streptomyces sp. NPDC093589 TaxID=3366043 RepID=UPI00382F9B76